MSDVPVNNYRISRMRKYYELSQDIKRIKATHGSNKRNEQNDRSNDIFSVMVSSLLFANKAEPSQVVQQSETINDYWDIDPLVKKHMSIMQQILILQKTFRVWIDLNNLRKGKKVVSEAVEFTVLRQSVVRQWLAITKFISLEISKDANDEKFRSFIKEINDGLSIQMFSKTFGALKRRVLKFDSTYTSLIYKTSKWMPPSAIKLSSICDVKKGLSGFKYSQAINANKAWCFQLHVLGGKVIDLQADDGQQARDLFQGFRKLVLLFFTQAPFYIDKNGIPRRAGSSIIKNALQNAVDTTVDPTAALPPPPPSNPNANQNNKRRDSTVSEADRMRYRAAVQKLKREYGEWNKQAIVEARRLEEEQELQQLQFNQQRNSATAPRTSSSSPQSPGAGAINMRQSSFATPPPATTPTHSTRSLFPPNPHESSEIIKGARVGTDEIADRRIRSRAETLRKSSIEFVFPDRTLFSVDKPDSDNHMTNIAATGNTGREKDDHQEEDDDEKEEEKRNADEKIRNQNSLRNESLRLILGIESYKKESDRPMGRYDENVIVDKGDSSDEDDDDDDDESDYYSDFSSSDSEDYST